MSMDVGGVIPTTDLPIREEPSVMTEGSEAMSELKGDKVTCIYSISLN